MVGRMVAVDPNTGEFYFTLTTKRTYRRAVTPSTPRVRTIRPHHPLGEDGDRTDAKRFTGNVCSRTITDSAVLREAGNRKLVQHIHASPEGRGSIAAAARIQPT